MFNLDFSDRHIVVTGGTGALGAAVVQLLIDCGGVVHIPSHRPSSVAVQDRVHVESPVELTDEAAVSRYYAALPPLWASVHVAGGFAAAPIAETSLSVWDQMHAMNGVSCFLCCREAVKKIRLAKGGGRIVNVAAKPAMVPTAGLSAYSASKAVVVALTTSLSEELAAEQIWVNAVVPSTMDTPINRKAMPDADFEKWPKLSEVAATVGFLASPQNLVTRGALVPVYGRS
jgi:NAD(P)-dependent dehydrogenase (short-subunit alcohol dehydrogenase family)